MVCKLMESMRRPIFCLMLFFCIMIICDYGISRACAFLYKRLRSGQVNILCRVLIEKSDVIILGSSRPRRHLNPQILSAALGVSVINSAQDGMGLPTIFGSSDVILRSYHPKLVLIELDPQFAIRRFRETYSKRILSLAPFWDQSDVIRELTVNQGYTRYIHALVKSSRFNGVLIPLFLQSMSNNKEYGMNGYAPLYAVFDPNKLTIETERNLQRYDDFELDETSLLLLERVIGLFTNASVKVLFVTSPVWPTAMNPDIFVEISERYQRIAQKHAMPYLIVSGGNFPVFTNAAMFADEQHLNAEGAKIYSTIVADEIVRLGLIP